VPNSPLLQPPPLGKAEPAEDLEAARCAVRHAYEVALIEGRDPKRWRVALVEVLCRLDVLRQCQVCQALALGVPAWGRRFSDHLRLRRLKGRRLAERRADERRADERRAQERRGRLLTVEEQERRRVERRHDARRAQIRRRHVRRRTDHLAALLAPF